MSLPPNPASSDPIELTCSVDHIVYSDHQSFTVLSIRIEPAGDSSYAVGWFPGVQPGSRLKLMGHWEKNPKYGLEFKTSNWEELPPDSEIAVEKYLTGHFHGIGPKLARRIVQQLGTNILAVLDQKPDLLLSVHGIGKEKYDSILKSWNQNRSRSHLLYFFSSLQIGPSTAAKIIARYGEFTEKVVRSNPYQLAQDIYGIGFLTADRIADKLSIAKSSSFRMDAGFLHTLEKAEDDGHCCLPRADLLAQTCDLLKLTEPEIEPRLPELQAAGQVVERIDSSGNRWIFGKLLDRLEEELARNLTRIKNHPPAPIGCDFEKEYLAFQKKHGVILDSDQLEAVRAVLNSQLLVITGGPGTGKTTILKLILNILKGHKVKLAAPTGRAAQRMHESTGHYAETLHRLLEFDPRSGCFKFHSTRRLSADTLIIDESSMLDLPLAAAVLRAVPDGCRMIFVGDADQLPSVGPGQVLLNIIDSGIARVLRLNKIFRQSSSSRIVSNAHRIIAGYMPQLETKSQMSDFYFIPRGEPQAILKTVCSLPQRIARHLGIDALYDVQVLAPMYRGLVGIEQLNKALQNVLNPSGKQIQHGRHIFRLGDKVMQIRNNYEFEVFNGDTGKVVSVSCVDAVVQIQFSDRIVSYTSEQMDQIVPAFACSIHKSQGSEYAAVIIPLHTQHYLMLRRNLLYTAVTRGKRMVVIVGTKKALGIAVHRGGTDPRNTLLEYRIRKEINLIENK